MRIFFSSDAFELYRKDILSVLSLPKGYAQHFRYPKHQVTKNFPRNLGSLPGQEGVIAYVSGNDLSIAKDQRIVKFLPIRRVRIIKATFSPNTDLLHFHLELLEFISGDIQRQNINANTLPPYEFICDLDLQNAKYVTWQRKIQELVEFDDVFKEHLFCNLEFVKRRSWTSNLLGATKQFDPLNPQFEYLELSSYIDLKEDQQYWVNVSTYNSAGRAERYEDFALASHLESDDLELFAPDKIIIGGQRDDRTYTLATKVLKSIKSPAFMKLQSLKLGKAKDEKDVELFELLIRFNIRKPKRKIATYGFLMSMAFTTSFFVVYAVAALKEENHQIPWTIIAVALGLSVASSTGLYYFFNKQ